MRKFSLKKYRSPILYLISLLIAFAIFGPNLKGKLWIIDDHYIVNLLGPDQHLSLKDAEQAIFQTEIFKFGEHFRYRTSYWPIKIFESFLWGEKAGIHYLFRILIFSNFVFVYFYFFTRRKGFVWQGFSLALLILPYQYYADIFSRLSAGEAYACFGVTLYIWGHYIGIQKDLQSRRFIPSLGALLYLFGGLIAIGSKEAFVIILIPAIYVLWKQWNNGRIFPSYVVSFLLQCINSIIIIFALRTFFAHKTEAHEYDGYGIQALFELIMTTTKLLYTDFYLLPFVGLILLMLGLYWKRPEDQTFLRSSIFEIVLCYISSMALIFSMMIFYKGDLFSSPRYQFPSYALRPIILYVLLFNLDSIASTLKIYKTWRIALFTSIFIGSLVSLDFLKSVQYLNMSAKENARKTLRFYYFVKEVSKYAKIYPSNPIVFESYSVWDYELITSLFQFLKGNDIKNEMFLNIRFDVEKISYAPAKTLASRLVGYSINGGEKTWGFKPIGNFSNQTNQNCIAIEFSKEPSSTPNCQLFYLPFP